MTICPTCDAPAPLHIAGCTRHRLLSCRQETGCDGVSHDIRCNDFYYRRKK